MGTKKNKLTTYKKKRNFKKTTEPKGTVKKRSKKYPIFVIQKHDATRLHYDLRLEIDGVLVSWAIPRGPSLDPGQKRLAIQTEDHPMSYAKFEGVIPEGEYGAGPVLVWDIGIYKNIKEKDDKIVPMKKCLKDGRIEVFLEGHKLQGAFALVRLKGDEKKKQWLFIKMRDEYADARKKNPVNTMPKSVLTERTIAQVRKEGK